MTDRWKSILELTPDEYAIRKELYVPTSPELVQAFDDLFQSPDYIFALGRAHVLPVGATERDDAENGKVSFQRNGVTWVFESKGGKKVSKVTERTFSGNDFLGQMSFDIPVQTLRVIETAEVDPGVRLWKTEVTPFISNDYLPEDLKKDGAYNDLRAIEKIKALIDVYNSEAPAEAQSPESMPEAVIFVNDEGRISPESRFISQQESWDTALKALGEDSRVSPNSRPALIRNEGETPYIHVFTADYYRTPPEELVELARRFPEVEIRFSWYQGSGAAANRLLGYAQPPFNELYPKGSF